MKNNLIIPIHIDAFYADKDTKVQKPIADYSQLPYEKSDETWENNDNPYNTETIFNAPFGGTSNEITLNQGLHLHWTMPFALTNGSVTNASSIEYPRVPNRWLIVKKQGTKVVNQWVVESDYVTKSEPDDNKPHTSSCIYTPPAFDVGCEKPDPSQPFSYLGRCVDYTDYQPSAQNADYIDALSTMGNGCVFEHVDTHKLVFSSYYPACQGVFGFYDEDGSINPDVNYEILGWYSNTEHDFINVIKNDNNDKKSLQERLKDYRLAYEADEIPDQTICYASLHFTETSELKTERSDDVQIAIGHDATEALSAFLASEIYQKHNNGTEKSGDDGTLSRRKIEEQLEALLLSDKLDGKLDLDIKFREARHEKGFTATHPDKKWIVTGLDADTPLAIRNELEPLLKKLNHQQDILTQMHHDKQSIEQQMYSLWYQYYLLYKMDPKSNLDDLIDNIWERSIYVANLIKNLKDTHFSELKLSIDEPKYCTQNFSQQNFSYIITLLNNTRTDILAKLKKYNTNNKEIYVLKSINGASYYRAKDPTLLLSGDLLTSSREATVALDTDGNLKCYLLTIDNESSSNISVDMPALAKRITDFSTQHDISLTCYYKKDSWHPLLFLWKVNLHSHTSEFNQQKQDYLLKELLLPIYCRETGEIINESELDSRNKDLLDWVRKNQEQLTTYYQKIMINLLQAHVQSNSDSKVDSNNIDIINKFYSSDELTSSYVLASNASDFNKVNDDTTNDPEQYSGYSIFSGHAAGALNKKLALYLDSLFTEHHKKSYQQAKTQGQSLDDYIEENFETLLQDSNINSTYLWAYKSVSSQRFLSQNLTGFYDSLIQLKQTLSINSVAPNIEQLKQKKIALNNTHTLLEPQSDDFFNPIVKGNMLLNELKIVSSFGQVRTINNKNEPLNFIASEPFSLADNKDSQLQKQALISPRLAQATQLSIDYLTDANTIDNSINPVSGWLIPSLIDNSLIFFDNLGSPLGELYTDDQQVKWIDFVFKNAKTIEKNCHLDQVRQLLQSYSENDFNQFLQNVENSLQNISPHVTDPTLAILFGRPIAVTQLSLELKTLGKLNGDISESAILAQIILGSTDAIDNNLKAVDFPCRVGEYGKLGDGTIGYWVNNADKNHEENSIRPTTLTKAATFHTPQCTTHTPKCTTHTPKCIKSSTVNCMKTSSLDITLNLNKPCCLTLLIDPHASIHFTTGILPVQKFQLEDKFYLPALSKIAPYFLCAPVLTAADDFAVDLPKVDGHKWTIAVAKDANESTTSPQLPPFVQTSNIPYDSVIKEHWLSLLTKEI